MRTHALYSAEFRAEAVRLALAAVDLAQAANTGRATL
jgi:hypothetical protein